MIRHSCWLGAMVIWTAAALPIHAQVKLEWKLKEGDNLYLEETVSLKQNVTLMKTAQPHELAFVRVTRFTVLKKNQDGGYLLEQKIVSIKLDRAATTGKADAKMLRDQEGAVFRITLTPKLTVGKLTGYEALVKKMAKDEDVGKMIRLLMPRQAFASATEAIFNYLPEKEVAKGDSWTRTQMRPLGVLGSLKIENTYTFQGQEKLDDRDAVKLEVAPARSAYSLPQVEGGSSFQVVKGDIKLDREKCSSTIYFSAKLGRMAKSIASVKMSGSVTVTVMGTTFAMDIDHEEKIVVRLLDKNPLQ